MKPVFTYLMALCVLAGICSRMVSFEDCESSCEEVATYAVSSHSQEHDCCAHEAPVPAPAPAAPTEFPGDPSQEPQCPSGHHHHHVGCSHLMPLVADVQSRISFSCIGYSRLLLSFEDSSAPETPVFELDKPPLI